MSNKSILFIFEDGRYGGPHSNFLNFCEKFKEKYKITVLYPIKNSNDFTKKLNKKKINNNKVDINILSLELYIFIKYIFSFFFDVSKIKKEISKKNYDYICIYTGIYSIKSLIAAVFLNKKIIWYMHDTNKSSINLFIFQLFFKKVKNVIFTSNKSKLVYLKKKNDHNKSIVLQSVIDNKNYSKKKFHQKKKLIILAAGNFSPVKNFELFLKIANFNKNNKNFIFYLVGNTWKTQNKYKKKIIELKKNYNLPNVRIIHDKRLDNYLKKADYFFCTSKSESSSLLILEAIKHKCIIFSTNVGDMMSSLKRCKYGFMINEKNIANISYKINNIEKSFKLKSKLISNGKKYLDKFHNVENYVEKLILKIEK